MKYQNIIDNSIIEVTIDKRNVKHAKFIESKTKNHLKSFELTETFNKFSTWVELCKT